MVIIIVLSYIDLPDAETTQKKVAKKPRVDKNRGFFICNRLHGDDNFVQLVILGQVKEVIF